MDSSTGALTCLLLVTVLVGGEELVVERSVASCRSWAAGWDEDGVGGAPAAAPFL